MLVRLSVMPGIIGRRMMLGVLGIVIPGGTLGLAQARMVLLPEEEEAVMVVRLHPHTRRRRMAA
jgi:hypothetical protein